MHGMDAGASLRPDSERRFSQSFRQDFDSWTNFWETHNVPEHPDVPNMRARLGHLVGLAGCKPPHLWRMHPSSHHAQ